jgi:hypothetical protein
MIWHKRQGQPAAGDHAGADGARSSGRNDHIDTARGAACLLLVMYHAIGDTPVSGLRLEDGSHWRHLASLLVYVRMPLFAFLAGFVYGLRPLTGDAGHFLAGKARRLLLPMLVVGTLFAVVQSLIPSTNASLRSLTQDWAFLHIVPVAHYWFLESLFIILLAIVILEPLGVLADAVPFSTVLTAAIAMCLFNVLPWYFGISGAAYLLPFFLCGLGCHRFHIDGPLVVRAAMAILVGTLGYLSAGLMGWIAMPERNSIAGLLLGVSISFIMVRASWRLKLLSFIGASAYAVFLFHPFFTAATRMLLHCLHISEVNLMVLATIGVGIAGPILLGSLVRRFALTRAFLLGEPWRTKASAHRSEFRSV